MVINKIRKAVRHDAASISKTFELAFRHAYTGILPYQQLNQMLDQRSAFWWQNYIENFSNIWTIEDNGIVSGYVVFGPNRNVSFTEEAEIYGIFVRPEYQGNGFGRKLFQTAMGEIKKSGLVGVTGWVFEENLPTVEFLKAMGGVPCGESATLHEGTNLKRIAFCWE